MGLSVGDIYSAIQLMLAPVYVNDFVQGGRVKRVNMQADARSARGRNRWRTSTRRRRAAPEATACRR
jgi:multidrug efflux pump